MSLQFFVLTKNDGPTKEYCLVAERLSTKTDVDSDSAKRSQFDWRSSGKDREGQFSIAVPRFLLFQVTSESELSNLQAFCHTAITLAIRANELPTIRYAVFRYCSFRTAHRTHSVGPPVSGQHHNVGGTPPCAIPFMVLVLGWFTWYY